MDIQLAREKSKKLGIAEIQIVREEYEMLLLSGIFQSPMGKKLVFRGGTALRLAYNSPRFSDDLDFSVIEPINTKKFNKWCQKTALNNPYLQLKEALRKRFTLFAFFRILDPALPETISIKLEVSVRKESWKQEKDYKLMTLKSEVSPLTALAQVASLERIEKEKLSISPRRVRDIFDLWYIDQLLKKNKPMNFKGFTDKQVKRDLNRLLALNSRSLIEPWLPKK